ncbi:binding-protein-dependent transport systems inner membrane component [Mahella australiensis 50-1 BON]|uniref:Binding-protein-dependent transport systems inner membrane component n=2 Tax=Mahella TaxID=252965 RepID=F3ZYH3_MAHA5|nr:binding-protein-dependent transport systems inner membrane component [Mahella australiensis 50-1 BON]
MAIEPNLFERVGTDIERSQRIVRPSLTYWQDAWRRLKMNKMAMVSLVVLGVIVAMAVIGPHLRPFAFSDQDLYAVFSPPNAEHWFGTDSLGRDLFVRVWMGARVSLRIGIAAALLDILIGMLYGGISGYIGGQTDNIMMRIVDILYAIPYMIIVILLMIVMEPGELTLIIAMSITGWVGTARLVRGQVLQLKEQEFVLAARALGASPWRIIIHHMFPNILGIMIVQMTMDIPAAIFSEAFLSYIGLGIKLPNASWGSLASDGIRQVVSRPWLLIFPALFISLTMLAFNLLGDGLRDALDPKMRS